MSAAQREAVGAFFAGALFAVGLVVAGMTQPSKVIGFLDFFGAWDPSLMFVMVGAIGIHFVLFRWILRRPTPLFRARFEIPSRRDLTPRLILGSAAFGAGWGLGGFCPGPGIASLGAGSLWAITFVAGMTGGFVAHRLLEGWARRRSDGPNDATEASVDT